MSFVEPILFFRPVHLLNGPSRSSVRRETQQTRETELICETL